MKLDTMNRKLEVLLAGTVSTTACPVVVCYRDENRNVPQNLGAVPSATQAITVSSVTVSTFLSAPSVNTIVRVPERITFKNADTGTVIPTFRLNDNATTYPMWSPTLLTGESAFYEEHKGFYSTDVNGAIKTALGTAGQFSSLTVSGNTTLGDAAADSLTVNAGTLSMPNIPAFLAYLSSQQNNKTGNGTQYTIPFDTEVFDQGSNFNNTTGTFTAPTTGKYTFSTACLVTGATVATDYTIRVVTSNRTYRGASFILVANASDQQVSFSVTADMDANDTATVTIAVSGQGADTVDVFGTSSPITYFSGIQNA